MDIQSMEYVTSELNKIEEFIKNSDAHFDDIYEHVSDKLYELKQFAKSNNIPFYVDAYELVTRYHDEPEYEEEYSSSYYEEDSYYEEEAEDSYYEENDDSF